MNNSHNKATQTSGAICRTCGGEVPNHVPSILDPQGIGHPNHNVQAQDIHIGVSDLQLNGLDTKTEVTSKANKDTQTSSIRQQLLEAIVDGTPSEERYVDTKAKYILDDVMPVIEAQITRLITESKIEALDDAYGYWHMHGGRKTGQFIKERIEELRETL